jgi:carotenoid cleavage dioxygenase
MVELRERVTERAVAWATSLLSKRVPHSDSNRFLEGFYAPVRVETTETDLRVTGELPTQLNGLLTRIGPNPISVPNPATYHWFIGDGMVHGLRLSEGKAVWYRNRYIGTDTANKALGRPRTPGKRRGVADVVNTNAIGHAGRYFALVEGGTMPIELDCNLESVRQGLFDSDRSLPFTAHPHLDPATGKLHAICYDGGSSGVYYIVIDAACKVERVVQITSITDGPMIHDCAITATGVMIFDLPVTLSQKAFLEGSRFPYRWNAKRAARVGFLPFGGESNDVRWYSIDPCYAFHTCNAYDVPGGGAAVDVVVHDTMFAHETDGPDSTKITFERWTLDPQSGTVKRAVRNEENQEFPRFDERMTGKPYRYGFTVGFTDEAHKLIRYDLETGAMTTHSYGADKLTSEAVFVPRASDAAEGDGWLMSYVYDKTTDKSDVVILDANDVGGEPAAIVHLPVRVPAGFHGNWVADPG